jgi:hypothetical protein
LLVGTLDGLWARFNQRLYYVNDHEKPEQVLDWAKYWNLPHTNWSRVPQMNISWARKFQGASAVFWECNYPWGMQLPWSYNLKRRDRVSCTQSPKSARFLFLEGV